LPLLPGTDVHLFNGLLVWLADRGHLDHGFIEAHTQGWEETLAAARAGGGDLETTARACGLGVEELVGFYKLYAATFAVITAFSQGVNQSSSGTDKVNSILNCHLATGRIGRPGAGPFSVTGQPNAMGGREVGGFARPGRAISISG
jgi:assimilatory nitrate reductase catalytic subunit